MNNERKIKHAQLDASYGRCREFLMDSGSSGGGFIVSICLLLIDISYTIRTKDIFGLLACIILAFIAGYCYSHKRINKKIDDIYDNELCNKTTK